MNSIEDLLNKTLTAIDVKDERTIYFTCSDQTKYRMHHYQNCCEQVYLQDVAGSLDDLLNHPLLQAEVVSSKDFDDVIKLIPVQTQVMATLKNKELRPEYFDDSETWTFYKLATIKGSVTLRWYGASNGYYSEQVDFEQII